MADLPSGTVSLLFSDIEGSTVLLSRLGAAYADALDGQRRVLRASWADQGGIELGTEGDSFFVAFPTAIGAVGAAADAERELAVYPWPAGEQVRVRVGIHTGSPMVHDGGYVGMDVHRAARIAGAAHGGQVVLSAATAELVGGGLPGGVGLRDLGSHRLKDLPMPEHLFQLTIEGLRSEFPALKALGAASSLPVSATPLVGRDGELAELTALLASPGVRLVTLTGPGGSGKTRLAVSVAERLVNSFPDGVFFVQLAAVTTAEVMWTSIAEAMDVPPDARVLPGFFQYVAHHSALVVLDNLEQLGGADAVVAELRQQAPSMVVLATSRRPLSLDGELQHAVPPLELPDDASWEETQRSGAVQLFAQRAQAVKASFSLQPDNAADVAAICRRLDGLPLAIELAAARTKLLTPHALLGRVGQALDLKVTGIDRPTRQQTLRNTIGWSYDLLNPQCQALFRHLGVFAGGADLDAIAAVAEGVADGVDVWNLVADLVDTSLATIGEDDRGEPRVGMLETVRAFARDRLATAGELDDACRRHAQYYTVVAQSMAAQLHTPRDLAARNQLETDYANIREALTWCLQPGAPTPPTPDRCDLGLLLAATLREYWTIPGVDPQAEEWLQRAVDLCAGQHHPAMADALVGLSRHMWGHPGEGIGQRALDIYRALGDKKGMAEALHTLEWFHRDDFDTAQSMLDESIALAREAGDEVRLSWALGRCADLGMRRRQPGEALVLLREATELAHQRNDERTMLSAQLNMTEVLISLERAPEGVVNLDAIAASVLASRDPGLGAGLLSCYAELFAAVGDDERAGRLLGAHRELSMALWPSDCDKEESWIQQSGIAKARSRLGDTRWEQALQAGRSHSLQTAVIDASEHRPATPPRDS